MKIFSLQSKIGLVAWSVVLGSALFFISDKISIISNPSPGINIPEESSYLQGIPFHYEFHQTFLAPGGIIYFADRPWILLYNFIFWILVVFVVLFVVRHFKKKNIQLPSKFN